MISWAYRIVINLLDLISQYTLGAQHSGRVEIKIYFFLKKISYFVLEILVSLGRSFSSDITEPVAESQVKCSDYTDQVLSKQEKAKKLVIKSTTILRWETS